MTETRRWLTNGAESVTGLSFEVGAVGVRLATKQPRTRNTQRKENKLK